VLVFEDPEKGPLLVADFERRETRALVHAFAGLVTPRAPYPWSAILGSKIEASNLIPLEIRPVLLDESPPLRYKTILAMVAVMNGARVHGRDV
jgi:hypothetical protein